MFVFIIVRYSLGVDISFSSKNNLGALGPDSAVLSFGLAPSEAGDLPQAGSFPEIYRHSTSCHAPIMRLEKCEAQTHHPPMPQKFTGLNQLQPEALLPYISRWVCQAMDSAWLEASLFNEFLYNLRLSLPGSSRKSAEDAHATRN